MEVIGMTTKGSKSTYFAYILAVPLHVIRRLKAQDNPPNKDRGPHLLFDSSIALSSAISPFCSSPISYSAWRRNPVQEKKSKHPPISTPYIARHLTHVEINSSTGEYKNLPKEWLEVVKERGISTSDRKNSPNAYSEIAAEWVRDIGTNTQVKIVSDSYYGCTNILANIIQQEPSQVALYDPSSIKCVIVGDREVDKVGSSRTAIKNTGVNVLARQSF